MWMVDWQRTVLLAIGLAAAAITTAVPESEGPECTVGELDLQQDEGTANVLADTEANFDGNQRNKRQFEEAETNKVSENEDSPLGITDDYDAEESEFNEILSPQIKRFYTFIRQRNGPKSDSFKRGPGFRSWGGKRASKFSSWGGKRSAKFSSWGGKRSDEVKSEEQGEAEIPTLFEQFQKRTKTLYGGKRRPFQSWGGKRAYLTSHYLASLYPRPLDARKLLSWEGKRKFSSWGGKRSNDGKRTKPSFRSWGGKRSEETDDIGNVDV